MADRGRDLKFSLLSDVGRFDLDDPARQLEDVGDNARDMGRQVDDATDELRRLATQGRDAERELERMSHALDDAGDEAKDAAKRIDGAFDKIADSSKANLRNVGDDANRGMRQAGEATETFRDEAKSNLSEVASSFTGSMDSAVDVVQGTLGGIVGDLGPVGAAVGAAGAAAVGLIYTKIQEAREAVKELAGDLIDAGGRLGVDDIFSRISDKVLENESDVRRLVDLSKQLGLAAGDVAVAFSGNTREIDAFMEQLERGKSTVADQRAAFTAMVDDLGQAPDVFDRSTEAVAAQDAAIVQLQRALQPYRDQAAKAEEAQRLFAEATGVALETLNNYQDALGQVAGSNDDVATATEAAAKRQAKATKSTEDTWEDYRDTAVASIDDVIEAQERDIRAAAEFQANSEKVFAAVGQAGLDWALEQGDNADKAMQLLASAPTDKQREIVANYRELGNQSGLNLARGLTDGKPNVVHAADRVHASAAAVLGRRENIPVGVTGPSRASLESLKVGILRSIGTLVVPVKAGQSPYANTANNSRYRW